MDDGTVYKMISWFHNMIASGRSYCLKITVCFSFSFPLRSGEFLNLIHCHEISDWSPLEKEIIFLCFVFISCC